jgi:uncharacterized protein YodC (DUF2158 family)
MQATDFPIGTVVQLQSGGGRMTVTSHSVKGWLECASFDDTQPYFCLVHPAAVRAVGNNPETSAQALNEVAVEELRGAFKLRAGCDRVDHAAEDAAAEYRAYREQTQQHVCPAGLLERQRALVSAWKAKAHNNPEALMFLGALRKGTADDLRTRAADLLEAFAR